MRVTMMRGSGGVSARMRWKARLFLDERTQLLNQFGQLVVQYVRDALISGTDQALAGKRRDIYSKHLHFCVQALSPECQSFIQEFIPNIVDATIGVFLQLVDLEETIQLKIRQADGAYINLLELTDSLEGEYRSSEGWAASFTNERADNIHLEAERLFEANRNRPQQGSEI